MRSRRLSFRVLFAIITLTLTVSLATPALAKRGGKSSRHASATKKGGKASKASSRSARADRRGGKSSRASARAGRSRHGREIARGLVAYDAADAVKIAGLKSAEIAPVLGYAARSAMIHRDDLVVGRVAMAEAGSEG